LISAFEQACGEALPKHLGARRVGDVASFYANASKAGKQLEWQAHRTLTEICESTWKWQSNQRK
jgi:UDP-glucose 4-epimerase